jgi:ubiquinol-cytochrome c reductase core subunit 2
MRGNIMFSKVSREHIALGTQFLRDDLVDVVPMLFKNIFNPNYQVYEFLRNLNSTLNETNSNLADPHTLVQEKLHQVAYRTGLGNPVYASKESLNQFVRKDVQDYIAKFFSTGRIAVVGTGVDHNELKNLVNKSLEELNLNQETVTAEQSKYFGGEARIEAGPNSRAIYSVAFPSVAYTKKDYAAALVLKSLLGGPARVKYGNPAGLLAKASTPNTSTTAFIHAYNDTGLVGFTVEGQNSEVKKVVKDSLEALKSASSSITEQAFKAAKNTAIVDYDMSLSSDGVLEAMTREAFGAVQVLTDSEAISKVTAADVQKVNMSLNT